MEGFAVAAACRLRGVPVAIVRGISNVAGDREPSRWRIDEALEAAADRVLHVLEAAP
jgi:futalosine hydrolase